MSNCSCVYVSDDCVSDIYLPRKVRARKQHECSECHRKIEPGETYEQVTGMCEGDWFSCKTCFDCLSVRDAFFCEGYVHEVMWDYLKDHIRDVDGHIDADCLVPLTPAARRKVCELIEDAWPEDDDDDA